MNLSVVIPMYNREYTISPAIISVLNQTVHPMEIVVVDDCSKDNSVQIVRELCSKYKMIRLIQLRRNRGAQAARNRGIRAAKGEWILLLDSDDELVCNAIEFLIRAVENNPGYDVYYGDYYRKENDRMHYKNCRMRGKDGNYLRSILFSSKVLFSGPLIRKSALYDIGMLDETVPSYQEWDTHIRLSQTHKYYYIGKPVFIYNIHGGETISKDGKKDIRGFRYVMRKNGNLFLEEGGIQSIILYYQEMHFRCRRCNDHRQYYYLSVKNLIQFLSANTFFEKCIVKLFRHIWIKNKL
ncbi:MAG: glycosyltransferase family 2 protein [Lachnospiraceae bacterium]|nr:glycosyltransferase family 2 protein [Lachnospiraceae bacterium]